MFSRYELLAMHLQHKEAFVSACVDMIVQEVLQAAKLGGFQLNLNAEDFVVLKRNNLKVLQNFSNMPSPTPQDLVDGLVLKFPDCKIKLSTILNPACVINPRATPKDIWNIHIDWRLDDDQKE